MKPHIRIVLKRPLPPDLAAAIPGWQSVIQSRAQAPSRFTPAIDRLLHQYNLGFVATYEFEPESNLSARRRLLYPSVNWSEQELRSGMNKVYRLILRRDTTIPDMLLRQINLLPDVVSATPVSIAQIPLRPSFRVNSASLSRNSDQQSREFIRLSQAQDYSRGRPDITIAVLDTGIDLGHPELKHSLLPGRDFVNIINGAEEFIGDFLEADSDPNDEVGHGTHVAGIIAAAGIAMPLGVVPKCKILPVRVLATMEQNGEAVGAGLIENIDAGIKYAVDQGADIINMSLGVVSSGGGLPHQEVIDYAEAKGVTVVAAAGNDGQEHRYYPGAFPHVIAVGASSSSGEVSAFSTYGTHVRLVAPGENIFSCHINGQYKFLTGTSHAAPFVSGALALLKSLALDQQYQLVDSQLKYLLRASCDRIDQRYHHPKAGFGQLNVLDAVRLLQFKLEQRRSRSRSSSQRSYYYQHLAAEAQHIQPPHF